MHGSCLFLEFCSEHQVVINNTQFQKKTGRRPPGVTHAPDTRIFLITFLHARVIWGVLLYYTLVRCLVRIVRIATAFTGLFTLKLPSPVRSIVHKLYRDESWILRETGWNAQQRGRHWTRTPVVTSVSSAPGDHGISRSRKLRLSNPRPCWKQTILLPTASSKIRQLSSKTAFKHGCSVPQTNKVTLQPEWLVDSSHCINTATWWCRGHSLIHALIQAAHRSADGTIHLTDKEAVM